jgi:hypothetical protein
MFLQNSLFLFSDHAPVPWWSWCKSKKIRVRQCLSQLVSQKQGVCLLVINKIYRRFTIITRPAPPPGFNWPDTNFGGRFDNSPESFEYTCNPAERPLAMINITNSNASSVKLHAKSVNGRHWLSEIFCIFIIRPELHRPECITLSVFRQICAKQQNRHTKGCKCVLCM